MRVLLLLPVLALSGCFYTEAVNEAPQASLQNMTPSALHQGDTVTFSARGCYDREDAIVRYHWTASNCVDATPSGCVVQDSQSGDDEQPFTFPIESKQPMLVRLEIEDEHGAIDVAEEVIQPMNRAPEVELQLQYAAGSEGMVTLGRDVIAVTTASDPDGDAVTQEWSVLPPAGADPSSWSFVKESDSKYRLHPDIPGEWRVTVTVRDDDAQNPLEETKVESVFTTTDQPPCLDAMRPLLVPGGRVLVPRDGDLFALAVDRVADDLDPYPLPSGDEDPVLDRAHFRWWVDGQAVPSHDVEQLLLDPSTFAPGDLVSVRVEVADRRLEWPLCPADEDSCSVRANTCQQRATWKVEIR